MHQFHTVVFILSIILFHRSSLWAIADQPDYCRPEELTVATSHIIKSWRENGLAIARNVLDQDVISQLRNGFTDIVSEYAVKLAEEKKLSRPASDFLDGRYTFDEAYTALYEDNRAVNQGKKSDLPLYFRKETHRPEIYSLITNRNIRRLISCMLHDEEHKIYPVYMMRGKVPDRLSGGIMTVDWHQDAQYTFYWYSDLNTSLATMNEYADSIVNIWVPVEDVSIDLGPVQLVRMSGRQLVKAEMKCKDNNNARENFANKTNCADSVRRMEYLRISGIDEHIKKRPDLLQTATMKRGDVLFFHQYTYHRALPNISQNKTRWSLDFRFQRADASTLRSEAGFRLDTGDNAIRSSDDWCAATPSLRSSEIRNNEKAGNAWGARHLLGNSLPSAMEIESIAKKRKSARKSETKVKEHQIQHITM
jgi:ectoine hydroxylase-related dioxygenase (phytanoyl-CoA dioxygenase family)